MKFKLSIIIMIVVFAGMCSPTIDTALAEGLIIISNKSVSEDSLDKESIKKIYSGKMTKWSDNESIIVTVVDGSDFHKNFLKEYVKKSSTQFKRTWKKLVFTGKGDYPQKFEDVESLIDYVAKTKGAIGYITTDAADNDKVKVLTN